jgi:DNA-binding MarR family transcriptional regulator
LSDVRARRPLDAETKVAEALVDHKAELRLWLRLLTCTTLIETEVRRRLRKQFGETLPRFDLMAQLERVDTGMTLGEVSQRMMVSAGNVTSLVERLVASGYVERRTAPNDRRSQLVRLSNAGRARFGRLAAAHQDWVAELLEDLSERDIAGAMEELARVK